MDRKTGEQALRERIRNGKVSRSDVTRRLAELAFGKANDCVRLALEEMPEQDDTLERFIRSRLRGAEPSQENLKKIINALLRRGHSWEDIHAAVEHVRAEEQT